MLKHHGVNATARRAALTLALFVATSHAEAPRTPMTPSPPHEALSLFVGEWTTAESKPEEQFRETCDWLAEGRRHMVCRSRWLTATGPREGLSIFSYDPAAGQYVYHGYRSGGATEVLRGQASPTGFVFESAPGAGSSSAATRVTLARTVGGFDFLSETAEAAGEWKTAGKVTYLRQPAGEQAAVLEVMDRYLQAIGANDVGTMAALQTPDGMTYTAQATASGEMEIRGRPNAFWLDPARNAGRVLRERYWSPTVLVRGSIATVWAPYEFWVDDKTSHCGIDSFSFVKVRGRWLLSNSQWTVEPDACDAMRPADASQLRPAR